MRQMKYHALLILCMCILIVYARGKIVFAGNIDPYNDGSKYAWGENAVWINLEPSQGPGVTVSDDGLSGFAWGENIGWINLSPAGYGGVKNDGKGNLSGYAWGENIGWINFGGVTIDSDGNFNGWAWGENTGWIHRNRPFLYLCRCGPTR